VSDQVTALAELRKQLEAERAAARELCAAVDAAKPLPYEDESGCIVITLGHWASLLAARAAMKGEP
jgi:hypothetical protein